MREKILALAGEITGSGESELLETLCTAAEARWRSRLRQDVTPEGCGDAFVCAAAFTAAADMTAGRGGDGVAAFTAGQVSVKGRTASESADAVGALRQAAEALMAPYAESADFAFRGGAGMNGDWFQSVLARYGQAVTVETPAGTMPTRVFLQPVTERSEQVPDAVTGIGWIDGRLWLYLGDTAVGVSDTVVWNGKRFRVRSSRPYYIGETLSHWWASLEEQREAAE